MTNAEAIQYHDCLVSAEKPNVLRKLSPKISGGLLDLLEGMLTYNPSLRWTAAKCLKNRIFDKIRQTSNEKPCKSQIRLPLYDEHAFDYENSSNAKYSVNDLKNILANEIK